MLPVAFQELCEGVYQADHAHLPADEPYDEEPEAHSQPKNNGHKL